MSAVKRVNLSEWDSLVARSEQGTLFSTSTWFNLIGRKYDIWGYYKGNNLLGGIASFLKPAPLTPFQGIIIEPLGSPKYTTMISRHNEVAEALIPYCPERFYNHYTFPDIRPFKWAGWRVDVKYTYVVDLTDMDKLWLELDKQTRYDITSREQEIRGCPFHQFDELYGQTFERKGLKRTASTRILKGVYSKLDSHAYITEDGEAAVLVVRDNKRSYYLLGASKGEGGSSAILWKVMGIESKYRNEMDMVGCNDKTIARFKSGFAGRLMPYMGVYK